MTEQRPQRQLSAILAADVAGYSRLIGLDEEGALARLKELRRTLIDPKISEHRGRIVKTMGDGLLVQFASAVDAVRCAVEVQQQVAGHKNETDEDQRIEFRIGINVGDVVIDGEDIHGDGVNVATRLEGLAEPGGICVSASVHDQVRDKLDLAFEDTGEHQLKNIARSVRAYRIRLDGKKSHWAFSRKMPKRVLPALAALPALGVAVVLGWQLVWTAPTGVTSAIAVLPFDNIGGDESTGRLADGITEDIITDLARFPEFEVVARHSVEVLKGKDIRKVGKTLNVGYVLEGSIQRQEGRVRITAQLLDAASGLHLWSERWDRPAEDVFAVQEEIAELVTNRLGGGTGLVLRAERNLARRKRPENLTAYELYLLGGEKIEQLTPESIRGATRLLTSAVELDPGLARAWVELYHAHSLSKAFGIEDVKSSTEAAMAAAQHAVALDPSDAEAHSVLGAALLDRGELGLAKASFDTSLRLAPNAFEILTFYAGAAPHLGEAERGAELADKAVRLNPNYPTWSAQIFGWTYFEAGRYDDALKMLGRLAPENYGGFGWVARAGAFAALGRIAEANATVRQALEHFPNLTIESFLYDERIVGDRSPHLIEIMRLAGFPPCAKSADLHLSGQARLPDCIADRGKRL